MRRTCLGCGLGRQEARSIVWTMFTDGGLDGRIGPKPARFDIAAEIVGEQNSNYIALDQLAPVS